MKARAYLPFYLFVFFSCVQVSCGDITATLDSSDGSSYFRIDDSTLSGVFTIDSNGNVVLWGTLEVKGGADSSFASGIKVGNSAATEDGTIRWTGTDFEGYKGGWVSFTATGGGDFANGGEAGGADRTLGNTDAYSLGLETNNITRFKINSTGEVGIGSDPSADTLLKVDGTTEVTGPLTLNDALKGDVRITGSSVGESTAVGTGQTINKTDITLTPGTWLVICGFEVKTSAGTTPSPYPTWQIDDIVAWTTMSNTSYTTMTVTRFVTTAVNKTITLKLKGGYDSNGYGSNMTGYIREAYLFALQYN